jgi:hypothetical protein
MDRVYICAYDLIRYMPGKTVRTCVLSMLERARASVTTLLFGNLASIFSKGKSFEPASCSAAGHSSESNLLLPESNVAACRQAAVLGAPACMWRVFTQSRA